MVTVGVVNPGALVSQLIYHVLPILLLVSSSVRREAPGLFFRLTRFGGDVSVVCEGIRQIA